MFNNNSILLMNTTYLELGSNKGNRLLNISKAFVYLNQEIGEITNHSAIYETDPWGFKSSDKFINIAVELKTNLQPHDLLNRIKEFEKKMGRKKITDKYESREIDIDIIFFNNNIINDNELIIPHPRLHKRKFVLETLFDIIPDYIHPLLNKNIKQLYTECNDKCNVEVYDY